MRLTKDVVAALVRPAGKADYTEWDDDLPGFGVRMRGGSKKWDCQYRVNGKQRRESRAGIGKRVGRHPVAANEIFRGSHAFQCSSRLFWLVANARPSSSDTIFDSIKPLMTVSKSCMPSIFPSRIASSSDLPSTSPVSMYSRVRGLDLSISTAAMRPLPSARGIKRCETM